MAYLKFALEDGTIVYIESVEPSKGSSGLLPGVHNEHAADATPFTASVDAVRKMSTALVENLRSGFAEPPSDLSLTFGLKASGDVNALVIARGSMEANFNVSLRWHNDKDQPAEKKEEKEEEEK